MSTPSILRALNVCSPACVLHIEQACGLVGVGIPPGPTIASSGPFTASLRSRDSTERPSFHKLQCCRNSDNGVYVHFFVLHQQMALYLKKDCHRHNISLFAWTHQSVDQIAILPRIIDNYFLQFSFLINWLKATCLKMHTGPLILADECVLNKPPAILHFLSQLRQVAWGGGAVNG